MFKTSYKYCFPKNLELLLLMVPLLNFDDLGHGFIFSTQMSKCALTHPSNF